LDKRVAELIAAGEVVERPSSVVKELVENSIDAGASCITVEIKNGGVSYIRITDDGSGIERADVPVAFLRHATSKLRKETDLDSIGTLGFRGEALASVSAVAKVELLTRTAEEMAGTRYIIEGGEEKLLEDAACPQGTTIIVRDLFYNVPARMKFLKKDVTEANSVAAVVDRIALSHPEISFRLIRDGREELLTPGDGKLLSCIYSVFGREFASGLIPVDYTLDGIHVHGYASKPSEGRANRTMQHFFINGRYVKTRTAMAALEQAFSGEMMGGKFPSCVLHVDLPFEVVDVNVHPAKIEVRFVNERPVFNAVYHGVKTAIESASSPVQMKMQTPVSKNNPPFTRNVESPAVSQMRFNIPEKSKNDLPIRQQEPVKPAPQNAVAKAATASRASGFTLRDSGNIPYNSTVNITITRDDEPAVKQEAKPQILQEETREVIPKEPAVEKDEVGGREEYEVAFIGEAFSTYIIAQMGDSLYYIDKHAAHERIIYNKLKSTHENTAQMLLSPVTVTLSREEYAALLPELEVLGRAGFEVEDFGGHSVLVRALPMIVSSEDAASLIQEIAGGFASGRSEITADKLDWIYHSAACRAAVKAGDLSKPEELKVLAERVLKDKDIRTCPHGRPVCIEITKHEIEKQFGRVK